MFALETWMKKAAPHVVSAGIVAFGVWILIAGLRSSAPVLWICVALIPVVIGLLSAFGDRQTLIVWITGRQSATQQDKLPPLDASIRRRSKSIASVAYGPLVGDPCRPGHGPRWSGGGNCAACCEHRTAPHAKHERGRPPERRSAKRPGSNQSAGKRVRHKVLKRGGHLPLSGDRDPAILPVKICFAVVRFARSEAWNFAVTSSWRSASTRAIARSEPMRRASPTIRCPDIRKLDCDDALNNAGSLVDSPKAHSSAVVARRGPTTRVVFDQSNSSIWVVLLRAPFLGLLGNNIKSPRTFAPAPRPAGGRPCQSR